MGENYLWLKFLHVIVAVIAMGTSAGLGVILEFYGSDSKHGLFVLHIVERMIALVVFPGYLIMLITGLWMAGLAWPSTASWVQLALGLWIVGIIGLGWSFTAVRARRLLHATVDNASAGYRRACIVSRISGGAFGMVVIATLYLMVFKPG